MRFLLLIVSAMMVITAGNALALGKSDGSKEKVAAPLAKKEAAKVEVAAEPVKVEPAVTAVGGSGDKTVVTINGVPITESKVSGKIDEAMKVRMGRMGAMGSQLPPETLKGLRDQIRPDIVDGLVLEYLVDTKLKERKITVSEEDVGAKIEEIMKNNNIDMDKIKAELAKNGVTMEAFKEQLRRNVGIERLINVEMKAAGQSPEISEEEAKKYYDENQGQFSSAEQVRASHILIKTEGMDDAGKAEAKKKIEDLLKQARGGADFGELAKQHSEDPGSKDKGGEYTFGRRQMVKPFEDAAFSLEVGQISDVVETTYGYHIIKLSEKIPAKTTSYDEAKESIKANLGRRKQMQFWSTLSEKLKSEAKIEFSAEEEALRKKAAKPPMPMGQPQVQPR